MSKFKEGDEIVRINDLRTDIKIGFKTVVRNGYCYKTPTGELVSIINKNWELVKPKWSIYNNTLPWSQLSDKQKGKLLLGRHTKLRFTVGSYDFDNVLFDDVGLVYKAIKPEPPNPEPTMAELFLIDWHDCLCVGGKQEQKMIAKGWTKPCK